MMKKTLPILAALLTLGTTICYGTLSATYAPVSYTGNGATEFAFPYSFFEKSDLIVYRVDADGVQTVLAEGSGAGKYTIFAANNDYSGGATVTTGSTYTDGQITIERSVPYGQELSIGGDFVPAKPLEQQLDKLAAQTQQTKDEIGRTITIPVTDSASLTTVLPAAAERASKLLACDSLGNIIAQSAVDSGTIVAGDGIDVSVANVISADIYTNNMRFVNGELAIAVDGVQTTNILDGDVTTAKIDDEAVTLAKMADMATQSLIGRTTAATGVPEVVPIVGADAVSVLIDDDTLADDSDTTGATQGSIKAYVDTYSMQYSGATVFTGSMPTSFTDLDLSATVGANTCFVHLSVEPDATANILFRPNGETKDVAGGTANPEGTSAATVNSGKIVYLSLITDTSGIVEWDSSAAGSGGTIVKVLAYQVLQD